MKRVAVLRGGISDEYNVSLQTGKEVLMALEQLGYPHKDIIITKQGEWLDSGFIRQPDKALLAVDLVFIALHGAYGEDGQIQNFLRKINIPFTGSDSLASALAFNKNLAKQIAVKHGIKTPKHKKITRDDFNNLSGADLEWYFKQIGDLLIIKPISGGSSIGVEVVEEVEELHSKLKEILSKYDNLMLEEYITGKETTVGILDNFRNQNNYVLPEVEIIPPDDDNFFSYKSKYNGTTMEIVPGRFSQAEKKLLAENAQTIHNAINCRSYSRSDFIINDKGIHFLEINTLPGLTKESLFPKAAAAVGIDFPDLIQHLIENVENHK